jgi:hypothetical protein
MYGLLEKGRQVIPWVDIWNLRPGFIWQKELGHLIKTIKSAAILSSNYGFSKRVMWVSVLVSDCPPDLVKPKLDDNIYWKG